VGVASSSKNCKPILESAKLDDLFETRVDGVVSAEMGLKGKPEGDIFVTAAANVGAQPGESVVVEDATSGVQAGRNGGFGLVIGVAREDNEEDLLKNGADVVVRDLAQITPAWIGAWFGREPFAFFEAWETGTRLSLIPDPKAHGSDVRMNACYSRLPKEAFSGEKKLVFFLDYDGTLTPIVDRPGLAVIPEEMRRTVARLAQAHTVAVVSGRMREDVEKLVGVKDIFFAGSHGMDIAGPGLSLLEPRVKETAPLIEKVIAVLSKDLGGIEGILIEKKKISVAVHYRLLKDEGRLAEIEARVRQIVEEHKALRLMHGKKVFEVLPDVPWDKGQAVRWILQALKLSWEDASVIYIGDDVTDENAFRVLRTRGTGVLVSQKPLASCAHFRVASPDDVRRIFEKVIRP